MVILAGGLGTRIRSLTEAAGIPKALVPVNGVPFIDHKLAELARGGARQVVLLVGHRAEVLEAHVGDGSAFGLHCTFVADAPAQPNIEGATGLPSAEGATKLPSAEGATKLLGTGGAVRRAAAQLPPLFWLTYGDTLLDVPMADIAADFAARGDLVGMTVLRNADRWEPSNVTVRQGLVVDYRKGEPPGTFQWIDYGMLLFRREAFDLVDPTIERFDLGEVLRAAMALGKLRAYEVQHRFHEIGTPEGLAETEAWLAGRPPQPAP